MWRKLWQWLKRCYAWMRRGFRTPPPPPPPPRRQIPDMECETQFMTLLDRVANGANRAEIQAFFIAQQMKNDIRHSNWIAWLQGFGERLRENPEAHEELARRMVRFGDVYSGELAEVAVRIGNQVLAQLPPPATEPETTEEVREKDEAEVWLERGFEQYKRGDFAGAIASYNEAIRLQPDYALAYYNRGVAQGNLGQYEEAIASFNEAIRLQPDFAVAYYSRGIAQGNLGQHEEAIASFNEAIRLQPDDAVAYYSRGVAQYNLGQYEEAIASYNEAIRLQPDFAVA
ncbi:tetratricopeptide repeat protein, partial [Phormidium sp. CCY1219]|uniref:tetratricopeptide repeat protein n=1 Tax=Phormidium sp. CCY1219 TaxID=2886104 RepID=UPI002D1F7EF8